MPLEWVCMHLIRTLEIELIDIVPSHLFFQPCTRRLGKILDECRLVCFSSSRVREMRKNAMTPT